MYLAPKHKHKDELDKNTVSLQQSTGVSFSTKISILDILKNKIHSYYNCFLKFSFLPIILVASCVFLFGNPHIAKAASNCGGAGTVNNPYLICNISQLQDMQLNLGASYKLANNIDAAPTESWNSGAGFEPIGYIYNGPATSFTGNFDGDGRTISNLHIIRTGDGVWANAALFGWVGGDYGALTTTTIKNVNLTNVHISGDNYAAGIIGYAFGNLVLAGNSVSGLVSGTGAAVAAAGLITQVDTDTATISGNSSSAIITSSSYSGGLIGQIQNTATVSGNSSTGAVTGSQGAGGLISQIYVSSDINTNYATGVVTCGTYCSEGGFVGIDSNSTFSNNYSTGNVFGGQSMSNNGGFAGVIDGSTFIKNYTTGKTTGGTAGGFYGYNTGSQSSFSSNYWLDNNSLADSGSGDVTGITIETDPAMKQHATFVDWDFPNVWTLDEVGGTTYPLLAWQGGADTTLVTTHTLTYTAGAHGSITGTSPQTVNNGANGTQVTATPAANYHFVSWSDNVMTAARTDLNVTGDITVTATFAIDTYTITSSVIGGNGTISPTPTATLNYGATQAFTITPNSGYYISNIAIDSIPVAGVLSSPYTFTNVTAGHTIGVSFTANNTRVWDGGGTTSSCGSGNENNWSCADNWTGNTVPSSTDNVVFDGTSTKTSTIDSNFAGTIKSLSINSGYTDTVSASRDLTITGDINLAAGTFAPGNQTINVGGSWNNTGGIFTKGASTVNFNGSTAGKTINTGGTGTGKDFYNMTVNGAAGGAESGLAGYWKFDGNGNDSSGNGKAATLYGSAGFVTAKYGNGLNLNGNLGNFAATASSVLGSGSSAAYSFSVWAYARNDRGTVISDRSGSSWVYKYLLQTTPTASSVNACTDNSCQTGANTNSTYANTGWHHITGTFDNTNNIIKLYVDGSFTNQSTAPFDGSNSGQVYFGKFSGPVDGNPFDGIIDEARVYDHVLSQAEVSNLYTANSSNPLGSYALSSAISATNNLTVSSGTLDASGYNVTAGNVIQSGGTFTAPTSGKTFTVNGGWNHSSGTFTPGTGTVTFAGDAAIQGDTTFNNFTAQTGGKTLTFADSSTQTITGTMKLTGTSGSLVTLRSSTTGTQWKVNPATADVSYVDVKDSNNTNATAITANYSNDSLNNTNWTIPCFKTWTGVGSDSNWSTADNWSGSSVPTSVCDIVFDGTSTKASTIDTNFAGTVDSLSINSGYTDTVSASRELTITGDVNLAAGTFAPGNQTINVAGSWNNTGGTFAKGSSTINFNGSTAGKTINTGGTGTGKDFYNMTVAGGDVTASGGTVTMNGNYEVHTFTSDGTFSVPANLDATYLIVGGGGGGGGAMGGGGGAGGVLTGSTSLSSGNYSVVVGAGASGGYQQNFGQHGSSTIFNGLTALGGGGGGNYYGVAGIAGGSGGGGGSNSGITPGGAGTAGQGNNGGASYNGNWISGGGGGAGAVGQNGQSGGPGVGGVGLASSISGSSVYYAGGGGGGGYYGACGNTTASGGNGGGGTGTCSSDGNGTNGTANTGGGGGGGGYINGTGGTGGSGVVIISYLPLHGTYTLSSSVTASNNLAVSSGTLDASDYDVTVGNVIQSGGTFTAPTSGKTFTVNGGWNRSSGTFTPGTGTVTFAGDALIQGDTTFNNFTADTPGKTLTFAASSEQTISGTLNLLSTGVGTLSLVSQTPTSQWKINPQGTKAIANASGTVSVTDSDCTASSACQVSNTGSNTNITLVSNDTNWLAPITVSGTGYSGISGTINVAVNGVLDSGTTAASVSWSINLNARPTTGQSIVVFLDGATGTNMTTAVTKYSGGDVSDMQLNQNALTLGSNQNTTVANSDMTYDSNSNAAILFTNASNTITDAGDLTILASNTYAPGADTNVAGSWTNNGTFTAGTSTINFNGNTADKTIDTGGTGTGKDFYNMTVNGSAGGAESGLAGYWKMDEASGTATVADSSSNDITGTSSSSSNVGAGKYGNARSFNYSSSVNVPNNANLSSTTGTWSFWLNSSSLGAGTYCLMEKAAAGTSVNGLTVYYYQGNISAYFANGSSYVGGASTSFAPDGQWHLYTITYNSGSPAKVYWDGQLASTSGSFNFSFDTSPLYLGYGLNTGWYNGFNGSLDEARVYNRVLSQSEISNLYALNSSNPLGSYALSSVVSATNNLIVSSGTLTAGNYDITAGSFSQTGGTFSAPATISNTLSVTGSLGVTGGTFTPNSTDINIGTLTVDSGKTYNFSTNNLIVGAFSQSAGTFTAPSSSKSFITTGSYSYTGGTYNLNGGTLTLGGSAGNSTITTSGLTLGNLSVNGSGGTWTAQDDLIVGGNLAVSNGTLDTNGSSAKTVTITGDVNLSGGTLVANSSTINVASNWNNTGGALAKGTSTVNFNGSSARTVASSNQEFYNVTFSAPGNNSWIAAEGGSDWGYRKSIVVNNAGSALTDYQTYLTIDTSGLIPSKMQSSCQDLRFTDSTGATKLNYYLESGCGTASTKVWVKAALANGDNTIYMYHGNTNAAAGSNGDNTFILYDNFDGTSLDTNKWTLGGGTFLNNSGPYHANVSGGVVRLRSEQSRGSVKIQTNSSYSLTNTITTTSVSSTAYTQELVGVSEAAPNERNILGFTDGYARHYYKGQQGSQYPSALGYNTVAWQITSNNSSHTYKGETLTASYVPSGPQQLKLEINDDRGMMDGGMYIDYVITRQYTASVPTLGSIGAESLYTASSYALSSAISATNNLTVSSGTLDASGYDVTAGNIIQSGGTLTAPTSGKTFTVNGGWDRSQNGGGTFTPGDGTVTFAGDALIQGDTTFNNFTADTSGKTLTFTASSEQTISGTLNLLNSTAGTLALVSSSPSSQWKIKPQGTKSIANASGTVSVTDSNCTASTACQVSNTGSNANINLVSNDTNWLAPITVSGTGYSGISGTIKVAVNGVLDSGTTTASTSWSISLNARPTAGQSIVVFLDGATGTNKTTAVTKYSSGNVSGMALNQNALTLGSNQNTTVANSDMTYDSASNAAILFTNASNTITDVGDLTILAFNTYAPGADTNVAGSWTNNGNFTAGTYTVNFNGSTTGKTINTGGTGAGYDFYNITVNGASGGAETGLAGYWKMDEASGTATVADSSGNINTGTSSSTTNVGAGKFINARSFNGISNYIEFPELPEMNTASRSVSAWFKTTSAGIEQSIFHDYGNNRNNAFAVIITSSDQVIFTLRDNANVSATATSTAIVNDGNWHLVTAKYDATVKTVYLYIDGTLSNQVTNNSLGAVYLANGNNPRIGELAYYAGVDLFNGSIDEVRIFSRALSQTEISNLYAFNSSNPLGSYSLSSDITAHNLIISSGALDANGKTINVGDGGTFNHSGGTFTANSSTVNLAGSATILGSTTFYNLSASGSAGKTISFDTSSTQTVTGTWTATGTSGGNLILARSGSAGIWSINPTAWNVDYVTVSNSTNLAGAPINPANWADGGGNTNWSTALPTSVTLDTPTTSGFTAHWTETVQNGNGYKVYVSTTANADCSLATYPGTASYTINSPTTLSQAVTGKSLNTQYCVAVKETSSTGDSVLAYSNPLYTLTNTPAALTLSNQTSSSIKINLTDNGSTKYAIKITSGSNTKYLKLDAETGNLVLNDSEVFDTYVNFGGASGVTNTGLAPNTSYTYSVAAQNGNSVTTSYSVTSSLSTYGALVSGHVYTALDKSTNIGVGKNIVVTVNGGSTVYTAQTTSGGAFSVPVAMATNDSIGVFANESGIQANLFTIAAADNTNISNLELYTNQIVLRSETTSPITNTQIKQVSTCSACGNNLHLTNPTGTKVNFDEGYGLLIDSGKIYTPGAEIGTIGDLTVKGTLNLGANYMTVTGNLDASAGTVTQSGATVTFSKTSGIQTIKTNGQALGNVVFSNGGTRQLLDSVAINGTFNQTAGNLDLNTANPNWSVAGNMTLAGGTISKGSGTLTLNGDLHYMAATGLNPGNVAVGASPDTITLTSDVTYDSLTINTNDTLVTNGYNVTTLGDLIINGTLDATSHGGRNSIITVGGNFTNAGVFTASTSTVILNGGDNFSQTVTGDTTFNNLTATTIANSIGRTIKFAGNSTTIVNGVLTLTGTSSKILTLQSTNTSQWKINPTSWSVDYVDVSRSNNLLTSTLINPAHSTNGGNNTNWFSYNIVASTGSNGSISPSGTITVVENTNKLFTFTPSSNYHVSQILVDGTPVTIADSYEFDSVVADHTISVSFVIDTNTITASAGSNGSISPTGSVVVNYGANQSFTITPNSHYHIADVLVDGVSAGAISSKTFTNVTSAHTISATFAIDTNTITASAGAHGSISPSGSVAVGYGADQSFTITPNSGYHVDDVLVDSVSAGAVSSYIFTGVITSHTISVSFAQNPANTQTISASAGLHGSISPAGSIQVTEGADQSFTITPDSHYHITDVLVDSVSHGVITTYTFTGVTTAHTISATFASDTNTITASAGSNGSISPTGSVVVNYGADQSFTITPDSHYHIADVLVDGVSAGAISSKTFTNVTSTHTISATFAIDTYIITASNGANGTISPSGDTNKNYGSSQTFTITPNSHYHIADVLVDSVSQGAISSYTFSNISAVHTISATFAINTNTITASAGTNGSISPSGLTSVNYGSNQAYTITPNAHYHISDVLIDGVSAGIITSHTFTSVAANHTISATFSININIITASAEANGSVSPSGLVSVDYGSDQQFTINPDRHYQIADVLVDGVSEGAISTYTFSGVSDTHTISASFTLAPVTNYTITASAGANGTISPSGALSVTGGDDQQFNITANDGYHIDDVLIDNISEGDINTFIFSNIGSDHTISATFAVDPVETQSSSKKSHYTITASAGLDGVITPSGVQSVKRGYNQIFNIKANDGYKIDQVLIDGNSVGPVETYKFVNVVRNHSITVEFVTNDAVKQSSIKTDSTQKTPLEKQTSDEDQIESLPNTTDQSIQPTPSNFEPTNNANSKVKTVNRNWLQKVFSFMLAHIYISSSIIILIILSVIVIFKQRKK